MCLSTTDLGVTVSSPDLALRCSDTISTKFFGVIKLAGVSMSSLAKFCAAEAILPCCQAALDGYNGRINTQW